MDPQRKTQESPNLYIYNIGLMMKWSDPFTICLDLSQNPKILKISASNLVIIFYIYNMVSLTNVCERDCYDKNNNI